MDRALKERIVGAIVLVVLAVLIVPVFLDGPEDPQEVITERIPLPGQEEQPVKTIVLDRDRDEPVPTSTVVDSAVEADDTEELTLAAEDEPERALPPPVADPEPIVETRSNEPADDARPTPAEAIQQTADSATGMWAVQIGSFSSKENADRLAADLRRQGFAAFLSETAGASGQLHRVRVGPQKDRPAAEAMQKRLQDAGQTGQVVPHP